MNPGPDGDACVILDGVAVAAERERGERLLAAILEAKNEERREAVAAERERWIGLLREARQFVFDAGNDECPEAQRHAIDLVERIDAAMRKDEVMVGSIGDIIERDHDAWMALLDQAVTAERERCEKVCDDLLWDVAGESIAEDVLRRALAAIRKGEPEQARRQEAQMAHAHEDTEEDEVMTAMRMAGWDSKMIRAVTYTSWKDGIDIDRPATALLAFARLIRSGLCRVPEQHGHSADEKLG